LIPEGYDLVGDEYVRVIPTLFHTEIEKQIESNAALFFNRIGYAIKKLPRMPYTRTVDYEYEDVGVEVTSVREYLPKKEVDSLLAIHEQTNCRICAYMYLKDGRPNIQILDEQKLNNKLSILCLQQHVSCYRPKIITKIRDKYNQDENHSLLIIMMDFRLAHFDPLSLKREIKIILASIGMELPSLGGILVSTPKELNSDMLSNQSDYVFVNNTYCNSHHAILKELNNYSLARTSVWITLNSIFIKKPSNATSFSMPCSDCPDRVDIERKGLPTFQF
jgi:hypothetical protein